jgi:Rieske Fe-S protein
MIRPESIVNLVRQTIEAPFHFVAGRLRRAGDSGSVDLEPGEGAIVDDGMGKTALYRDEAGELHALSARCTHLSCIVRWNSAEGTWDCPCHGSRFEATGAVMNGPASKPLASK